MKIKKTFTYNDNNQIWRLLISESDKLIIETRNTDDKEVFFSCFDLNESKLLFSELQFEEKFWVGLETIQNDVIYFHMFAKPDMPEHKKIIAYDIAAKEIIWQNDNLTFVSIYKNKLYALKRKFEGQDVFVLNPMSGEVIEELPNDSNKLNEIMTQAELMQDYSNYTYPEFHSLAREGTTNDLIKKEIKGYNGVENIESIVKDGFVCFNYYVKTKNNLLDNIFAVYNIDKKKKVLSEVINKNLNSFSPDSFFGYKDNLFVLKNKNQLVSYKFT